jgi:hypothetical protein
MSQAYRFSISYRMVTPASICAGFYSFSYLRVDQSTNTINCGSPLLADCVENVGPSRLPVY